MRVRQKIKLTQGIASEKAKEIVRVIKDSKKKVQASIQVRRCAHYRQKTAITPQVFIALLKKVTTLASTCTTNFRTN